MSACMQLQPEVCIAGTKRETFWYLDAANRLAAGTREYVTTCNPTSTNLIARDADGNLLTTIPAEVDVEYVVASTGLPGGAPVTTPTATAYAEIYRLAWDQAAIATPTTGTGTPQGAMLGVTGNTVTITGPIKSLSWKWLPATSPIPDVANPPNILDPVVTVNGLAYVAVTPTALFTQSFSHTIDSGDVDLSGNWSFTTADGAFIEIQVIKAS